MSAIDDFNKQKSELGYAEYWASMLGKEYHGGGGGHGYIASLTVAAEIYFQYSDGATNYHALDKGMAHALAKEIKQRAPELISAALTAMREESQALAKKAAKEHADLLKAAGITFEEKTNG